MTAEPSRQPARARKAVGRPTTINIRAMPRQVSVIDQAAEAKGQTRSAFMLEHAVQAAEAVLLDQRLFVVDDATFDAFQTAMEAPIADNPRLAALLKRRAPWAR